MAFDMQDYVEVKDRVREFYERYPDGRIVSNPPEVRMLGDRYFIEVTARVYRSADDETPCQASAWEPYPGRTPYTKDSEMMNAETSAIGRACAAAGIAVHKSMASATEVRNRRSAEKEPSGRKEPAAVAKKRADILRHLNSIDNAIRSQVKKQFVDEFGAPPASLDADALDAALAWVQSPREARPGPEVGPEPVSPETALSGSEAAAGPDPGV